MSSKKYIVHSNYTLSRKRKMMKCTCIYTKYWVKTIVIYKVQGKFKKLVSGIKTLKA